MNKSVLSEQASDILAGAIEQVATAGVSAVSSEIERRVQVQEDQDEGGGGVVRTLVFGALVVIGAGVVVGWVIDRLQSYGPTDEELNAAMAADDAVTGDFDELMVAVNLKLPPSRAWEGVGRVVSHRMTRSAILPLAAERFPGLALDRAEPIEIANLRPGDAIAHNDDGTTVLVNAINPGRVLALVRSDGTASWSIKLEPDGEGGTRLVSRRRAALTDSADRAKDFVLRPVRSGSDLLALLDLNEEQASEQSDDSSRTYRLVGRTICEPRPRE